MLRLLPTFLLVALSVGCSPHLRAELPPAEAPTPEPPPVVTSLRVDVFPSDAQVIVAGRSVRAGEAIHLAPGGYELQGQRVGYAPLRRSIELVEGTEQIAVLELEAQEQELRLDSFPASATVRVLRGDALLMEGAAPLTLSIPSGEVRVEFELPGYAPVTRSLFLDGPTEHRECLDRLGQLLDCQWEASGILSPKAVAYSPDGRELWATQLNRAPALRVYDAASGAELGQVEFGKRGAVELVFSPDGSRLYASQMDTATVYEVDAATRTVLRSFPTRGTWTKIVELSADAQSVFASNWISNDVSQISLSTGQRERRYKTAKTPRGLWSHPNGKHLYAASFGSGKLERIDLETGARTTVYQGGVLRHLEPDLERGRLYISDMRRDQILVMDMSTDDVAVLARTERHPNTITLSPDGRLLFVSCRGRNNPDNWMAKGPEWGTLLVLDALDGELLDVVVAGNQPTALDVSPDGRSLVLSDILDARLRSFRIPPYEELKAAVGGLPDGYKGMLWKR